MQPINFISNYYGEKYGFYFAYLAFYTAMLVPIAIIGLIFFILQMYNYWSVIDGNIKGVDRSLDWEWNYIYAIIVSLWATLVVEGWKRTQARIGNKWLMRDFKDATTELSTYKCSHGIDKDLKSPWKYKWINSYGRKILVGVPVTLFFLSLVFATQIGTRKIALSYKALGKEELKQALPFSQVFKIWPALANTSAMIIFEFIYKRIAVQLVKYENPRTDEDFEKSLSLKISMF